MPEVTFTRGGVTFTVYTDSEESPVDQIKVFAAAAPELFKLVGDIDQGARAADVFTARESTATKDVPVNTSTPPSTDIPTCPHGTMKDCSGMTIASGPNQGKPYKFRFYCPSQDRNNKCNPAGRD